MSPSRCPPWQPERPGPTRREPRRAQRSYTTRRDTITLRYEDLSHNATELAKLAMLNIVGGILVSNHPTLNPGRTSLLRYAKRWEAAPRSTIIAASLKTAPELAALVNSGSAMMAHGDDWSWPAKSHLSSVIFPAALALAESEGKSGKECRSPSGGVRSLAELRSFQERASPTGWCQPGRHQPAVSLIHDPTEIQRVPPLSRRDRTLTGYLTRPFCIAGFAIYWAGLSGGVSRLCFLLVQSGQGRVAGFGKGLASLILGRREVSPAGTSWPFSVVAEGLGLWGARAA